MTSPVHKRGLMEGIVVVLCPNFFNKVHSLCYSRSASACVDIQYLFVLPHMLALSTVSRKGFGNWQETTGRKLW